MTGTACGVSVGVVGVFHHNQLLCRPPTQKSTAQCVCLCVHLQYTCVLASEDVGDSMCGD